MGLSSIIPAAIRTTIIGSLFSVPLGVMPPTAQAQFELVPQLGKGKHDPKTERQINDAKKIIADMKAKGALQKEIEQETLRLSKEIVEEDKGLMGRLDLAVCIALILGICLIAGRQIEKGARERARQQETNPGQLPENK